MTTTPVQLRYFASLREALGPGETFELPSAATTAGALRDALIARGGRHAELLARSRAVRCAVDRTMAEDGTPVRPGAEVAFFPPVTGG
jgi:sulfur-carrier protein